MGEFAIRIMDVLGQNGTGVVPVSLTPSHWCRCQPTSQNTGSSTRKYSKGKRRGTWISSKMNLVLLNMTIGYAPFSASREKKEEKNSIRVVPASSASRCMLPSSATRGHLDLIYKRNSMLELAGLAIVCLSNFTKPQPAPACLN